MADKLELLLEAEKRGILPEDKKGLLDEARKRGLVPASATSSAPATGPRVPLYVSDEQGEFDSNDPKNADRLNALNAKDAPIREAQKADEKRLANRGMGQRVVDAASFGLSLPIRMATGGKYGIGDATGLLNENAGKNFQQSESDFARANAGALQTVADVGEASLGVPALSALGAPARVAGRIPGAIISGPLRPGTKMASRYVQEPSAIGATIDAMRASPRGTLAAAIRGTGESLEGASRTPGAVAGTESAIRLPAMVGRAGKGLQGYADNMQAGKLKPSANQPPVIGLPENIQTIPERLRDIQAFRDLEMEPFSPALGSTGTARAMRTVEEIPVVGGTVKGPKTTAEVQARDAQAKLARDLGAPATEEAAGSLVQRGLERYRGAGVSDIEPGTLRGTPVGPQGPVRPLGIEPYQSVKAAQRLTEGQAENAIAAEPIRTAEGGGRVVTARGAVVPAARPLDQIGLRRTNVEDLTAAERQRIIEAPSQQTSFKTRAEALYENAWQRIPKGLRTNESMNSNQIGWKNMQDTMRQIRGETANQIAGQGTIGGPLAARIMRARTHTNLAELRSIRTEIGRALSNFGNFETSLDRTQLNRLYSAASKDMEAGLTDLSNRAWIRTRSTGPDRIPISQAREADAGLYEFRRADRYFRQGQARMDKFMNVLDAKNPNEAARKIITGLKEKTANPGMLREIAGTLRPDELNSFRGHVIGQLGSKRPGAVAAESIFNWNNWATDYNAIMSAPGGREFMTKGLDAGVATRLDNLARVVNRMKYYEQTKNFSGSAYSAIGLASLSNPMNAVFMLGGGALAGKLFTSKAFLSWNEALMKAQLKVGNTAASNARIMAQYAKRLPALAKAQKLDPDTQQALTVFGQALNQQIEGQDRQKARALPAPSMP